MLSLAIYLLVYVFGGLTLLPGILLFCWYFYVTRPSPLDSAKDYPQSNNDAAATANDSYDSKRGWIRLIAVTEPSAPENNGSGGKEAEFENTPSTGKKINYFFSGPPSPPSSFTLFFAILRGGTLFCFDNEQQATCHWMIPVRNYTVSLYPKKGKSEAELFGRTISISLSPKPNTNVTPCTDYYISCQRPIDKEDWYFALISASHYILDDSNNNHRHDDATLTENGRDATLFDPWAMTTLRGLLDDTSAQVDAQCWNAMLGRLFLGVYKTEAWRQLWHTKMKNRLDKINNYHQHPLQQLAGGSGGGDHGGSSNNDTGKHSSSSSGKRSLMRLFPLQLQRISMGETIPCLTNAQLLEFTADGTCVIQAQLDYDGDLLVVLRTGLHTPWRPPSSLMSPFGKKNKKDPLPTDPAGPSSLPLVLSLKLRHCSGKVVFKIKPPPTCRVWAAFETMPTMEWQVTPVVLDKQIKWSYVTHLLQTKIMELVAESLVMPNMEDFPFYDSGGLGGIFGGGGGDAGPSSSRHHNNNDDLAATEEEKTTTFDDKDSAIDVDITNDDDKQQQQQQPPMVSTLVQGYMDRIRNPHKYPPTLSSLDITTTTTTNL